jgi:GH15 family glucan-1,4-alpha-glucosidase
MKDTPIKNYFVIGNLHTAALVSSRGSIDWLCPIKFDNPSLFAGILDKDNGGTFTVVDDGYQCFSEYVPDTAIVETFFTKSTNAFRVRDFMPPLPKKRPGAQYLVRKIIGDSGVNKISFRFSPKPDYGKVQQPKIVRRGNTLTLSTKQNIVRLFLPKDVVLEDRKNEIIIILSVKAGESKSLVMEFSKHLVSTYRRQDFEPETHVFWQQWIEQGQFFHYCRSELIRSAITLKLMQYYPTGAIVAAPTTSLPEYIGGTRNWDYRFVWIRDATFTLYALFILGYTEEAQKFFEFIEGIAEVHNKNNTRLSLFYTIEGKAVQDEYEADHLKGYMNSRPVRVGNGAADQFQLDVYGSLIDAHYFVFTRELAISTSSKSLIIRLVDKIAKQWKERDHGIWEVRQGPQHYTYSKVMAWVGVNRALRISSQLGINPILLHEWQQLEREIKQWILTYCFDKRRNTFVQHPATTSQDASTFLVLLLQFFDESDDRNLTTIRTTAHELVEKDVFVNRYKMNDGLKGDEGAFILCTYWYIASLAYAGQVKEALKLFTQFGQYISPSGLLSEEIDVETKEYLGNFPQAFSHLGYIMAAYYIHRYWHKKYGEGVDEGIDIDELAGKF